MENSSSGNKINNNATDESSTSSNFIVAKERGASDSLKLKISSNYNTNYASRDNKQPVNKIQDIIHSQTEKENELSEPGNNMDNIEGESKLSEGNWKTEIRSMCMNIFLNFAKFSQEEKEFYLSFQNLTKILRTVNILDSNSKSSLLKMYDLDVILKKVNPSGQRFNSKQFMNFIVLLTNKIDNENFIKDAKTSVIKIIKTFFEPFSNFIEEKNQNELASQMSGKTTGSNSCVFNHKTIENKLLTIAFDENIIQLLNNVYSGIKYIYHAYFHFENNRYVEVEKIINNSMSNIIEFSKDFEIIPFFVNTDKVAIFFNLLLDMDQSEITKNVDFPLIFNQKKEIGNIFTISKFASFLVHIALLSFDKFKSGLENKYTEEYNQGDSINFNDISNSEKLILFLEKLECSGGFDKVEKKTNLPYNSRMSLIPNIEIIQNINPNLTKHVEKSPNSNTRIGSSSNITAHRTRYRESDKIKEINEKINIKNIDESKIDHMSFMSIKSKEALERIDRNIDIFKDIFETYSIYGDKFSFNNLSLSGFLRFLKDCNLIYDPSNQRAFPVNKNSRNVSPTPKKFQTSKSSQRIQTLSTTSNGRLIDNDASIIFHNLCGSKNFNNSEKIKNQFTHNKGFTPNIEECVMTKTFDQYYSKNATKNPIPFKMNFFLFLKSFEQIARKLHPDLSLDEALINFIDHDIENIIRERSQTTTIKKDLMEALSYVKKNEIIDLMNTFSRIIEPHYENYCDILGIIQFDQFYLFFKDFGLFPDVINLVQLRNIFFTLSDFFSNQLKDTQLYRSQSKSELKSMSGLSSWDANHLEEKIKKKLAKNHNINYQLFLDAILLTALHSKIHEGCSDVEKIVFIMDKMSSSKGIGASQLRSGKPFSAKKEFCIYIQMVKDTMPELFGKKQNLENILKSSSCFDELFS